MPLTSASLMARLRAAPSDQTAWAEFVDRYAPIVYEWCRQWKLQDADARDVTQAVLIRLTRAMKTFRYDPGLGFRKWLWTISRHAWFDLLADRKRSNEFEKPGMDQLYEIASRDDLLARLDREFDRELLEEASARVRLRVEPHTWEAFHAMAVERLSGAETSRLLKMSVVAAFKAKSKVLKMLREELQRLEGREDTGRTL